MCVLRVFLCFCVPRVSVYVLRVFVCVLCLCLRVFVVFSRVFLCVSACFCGCFVCVSCVCLVFSVFYFVSTESQVYLCFLIEAAPLERPAVIMLV